MFTGIISFIFEITINGKDVLLYANESFCAKLKLGDSVCVNGVCLTVVSIDLSNHTCLFNLTEETLEKTNFSFRNSLQKYIANVELPLKYGDYIGGHLISGHVHLTGEILSIEDNGNVWISLPSLDTNLIKYKGSIAINGISLTVAEIYAFVNPYFPQSSLIEESKGLQKCAEVPNGKFRVSLIPETLRRVAPFSVNTFVNIEFDNSFEKLSEQSNTSYMELAILEGEKGRIFAPPNPWVGCVIVKENKIIGKGYHEKCGSAHAEINAMNNCLANGENLEGATMYVTLEPCCLFPGKRTPACVDRIIAEKISTVIIGVEDPNPYITGRGYEILQKAGINVKFCKNIENNDKIYEKVCFSLRHYLYFRKTGLPYVTLKIALSADGCYRDGEGSSKWITHEESRKHGHYLRSTASAVMVGASTVSMDDPELNVRYDLPFNKDTYRRIVMDGDSIISQDAKIFSQDIPTIICLKESRKDFYKNLINENLQKHKNKNIIVSTDIKEIVTKIGGMHLLVEGGAKLHKSFLESGLVSEIVIFRSSYFFGDFGFSWNVCPTNAFLHSVKTIKHKGENNTMETYLVSPTMNKTENIVYAFDSIERAIQAFKNGGMVLVMDDEDRENEGDLIVAASKMTEKQMTEMINMTTGIICVPLDKNRAKKLNLVPMTEKNTDNHQTAFTVSVDAKEAGTGVSSKDRLKTIHVLANENSSPNDLRRPGHVFPLISKSSLKERRGHTEAAVTLCKLAGIYPPVAVIGELKNKDGTMKRQAECFKYAKSNNIPIITIEELCKVNVSPRILSQCNLTIKYSDKPWKFLSFYVLILERRKVLTKF
jgi:diaminohydroxyphosphoribosylaminopyrimidine deaminase/5-amino-6-(5-phosphoribosylamino)uracil reductase